MHQFQNHALQIRLTNTLRSREKVLWSLENATAPIGYKLLLLYGLVFSGFWLFMVFNVFGGLSLKNISQSGSAFLLMPIIFFSVGIIQFLVTLWGLLRRNRFAYAVTDQRVIIMNGFRPMTTRSFGPRDITSMSRSGTPDKGTITLTSQFKAMLFNYNYGVFFTPAKLVNIPDAKRIEDLIYSNLIEPMIPKRSIEENEAPNKRKPNLFHG